MEGRVSSFGDRCVLGGRAGSEVDGLEDVLVEASSRWTLKGKLQHGKDIGQSLDTKTNWTVAHVGVSCFLHRVVVDVDDTVQVARSVVGHIVEKLVVKHTVAHVHKLGQSNRGEVTNSDFVLGSVLHDLRAQVGGANRSEVLLIGFLVGGVLVQHVWRSRFNLGFDNLVPHHSSRDGFSGHPSALIVFEHGLEFSTVDVLKTWAFVWTEERPVAVVFHPLHEQVGRPHGVEEVACTHLFLPVVLLQVKELKDVRVPRLEVNRNGTLALAAALVNVSSRIVEHTQHWNNPVGRTVGALDVGTLGAYMVN